MAQWTPMRWPHDWTDPTLLDLLQGSAIDSLLIDSVDELRAVRARAQELGFLQRRDAMVAKGEFPGVRMARGSRATSAGPTGVPWVNSNGWLIRLHKALHPGAEVWIDAPAPTGTRSYLMAVADSAAHGGRWIVSLDDEFAGALRERQPAALDRWKTLASATMFFAQRQEWSTYTAVAVVGVVSDFSGSNEFFSHELLNLLARAGQHSRILPKDRTLDLGSLRA